MATLSIIKYSNKVWKFLASDVPTGTNGFSYSKLQADSDGLDFFIVSEGGATTNRYQLSNITVFASVGGTPETGWASMQALLLRLEDLNFPAWNAVSGSGGATAFIQLTDTPASYSGQGGKVVAVKDDATGLEFIDAPSGATPSLAEVLAVGDRKNNQALDGNTLIDLEAHLNLVSCDSLTENTTFVVPTLTDFNLAFPSIQIIAPEFKILNNSSFTITLEGDTGVDLIGSNLVIPQNAIACIKGLPQLGEYYSVTYQLNAVGVTTPTLQEVTDEGNTTTNDIIVQPVNPEEGYLIQLKKEEGIVVSFENKSTQQTTAGFNIMNLSPSGGTLYGDESILVGRGNTSQKLVHPIPTGILGQILIPDVGNNTETMATREWVSDYIPSAIVESVTGDGVDNTDPANPVLTFPTPSEIGAEPTLGFTPENVANKATNLTSPDNTKYPTTQAVVDGLATKFTLPALTNGSVLFSNGTTIAQDNAQLFWDDANNRLGIGNASPQARLDVRAQGALSTDIAFRVRNSADSLDLISLAGNGVLLTRTISVSVGSFIGSPYFLANTIPFQFSTTYLFSTSNITSAVATSGIRSGFIDVTPWSQSSGNAEFTSFRANPTINQTGSASGITRGLFINPTLTSAFDFRAIESTNGGAYINTTSVQASAILQADSTTQGFLPPRMTNAQRLAIATPAVGLMVYCTDATEGLYENTSTGWVNVNAIDATPTSDSNNAVSSNGVFDALALKVDKSKIYNYKNSTASAYVTGTVAEVEVLKITIPANTFASTDVLKITSLMFSKIGANNTYVIKGKLSTSDTIPSGDTDRIFELGTPVTHTYLNMYRTFYIDSGNIKGSFFGNALSSDINSSTLGISSSVFDITTTQYLYISVKLNNASDQVRFEGINITN